jgi:hypothetical protein
MLLYTNVASKQEFGRPHAVFGQKWHPGNFLIQMENRLITYGVKSTVFVKPGLQIRP